MSPEIDSPPSEVSCGESAFTKGTRAPSPMEVSAIVVRSLCELLEVGGEREFVAKNQNVERKRECGKRSLTCQGRKEREI